MKDSRTENNLLKGLNSKCGPVCYEIMVQGQLDPQRSKWFEGMTLTYIENGESGLAYTLIAGPVIDQPALHGLLTKIRDLNLVLISVRQLIPGTGTVEQVSVIPGPLTDRNDLA
jgi:hypothetical protein